MGNNKLQVLKANTESIRMAFRLHKEQRTPTDEERLVLQKYSGFGGIENVLTIDCLDETSATGYEEIHAALQELKDTLMTSAGGDEKKYKRLVAGIKSAVLTAYYTPSCVISAVGECIRQTFAENGLRMGTFLEPSAGIGGFLPVGFPETQSYAFEKDAVSGLILSLLHPQTHVCIDGFESVLNQSDLPSRFDVIASNIPFGTIKVADADFVNKGGVYASACRAVHNYFFVRALERLKEGGLLAFITSRGVSDAPSNRFVREYLVHNANLITTLRLPDNLFGIEVGSDLLIMQKRSGKTMLTSRETMYLDTMRECVPGRQEKTETTNKLLVQPRYVLATEDRIVPNQYGKYVHRYYWKKTESDLKHHLSVLLASDFKKYFKKSLFVSPASKPGQVQFDLFDVPERKDTKCLYTKELPDWMCDGALVLFEGKLGTLVYPKGDDMFASFLPEFVPIDTKDLNIERAADYFGVRDAYMLLSKSEERTKREYPDLRLLLNSRYDAYVSKWGAFHYNDNQEFIMLDVLGKEVLSIEICIDGQVRKSDIMREPVAFHRMDDICLLPLEALANSLNFFGEVNLDYLCEQTKKTENEVIEELSGEMYYNALTDCWEEKCRFLSGNVIAKSEELCALIPSLEGQQHEWTEKSVQALAGVIPQPIGYEELDFNLGERWIPCDIYARFATEFFGVDTTVTYIDVNDTFIVSLSSYSTIAYRVYSVRHKNGEDLFIHALLDTVPEFTKEITVGTETKRVPDEEAIQEAAAKIQEIRQRFNQWLDRQPIEVRDEIVRLYNRRFNCYVRPSYDGSAQTFPDLSLEQFPFKALYASQKDAIWMNKQLCGGVCWHEVGAGKTMVMCVSAYEMKRLGMVTKPLIIGLKANVHEIADCFRKAYPSAKLLYPGKEDFSPAKRKELFAKIKNNNWDCIILTHDQFAKIPQSDLTRAQIFEEELQNLERCLDVLDESGNQWKNRNLLNGLEKRKENLIAELNLLKYRLKVRQDEDVIDFHNMGIDHIFVDEYHYFKNLMFQTRHKRVAGIGNTVGSQRAMNLLIAIRDIQYRKNRDMCATFLSGTVVVNALTELYVLFKYLRPRELKWQSIHSFDAWAAIFTQKISDYELNVAGEVKRKERFRTYIKVPELATFLREITDYRTAEMINLDVPKKNIQFLASVPTIEQEDMICRLVKFAHSGEWVNLGLDRPEPNNLKQAKMLIATDIARKMALDMRMLDPERFSDDPNNKASICAAKIYEYYTRFNEHKGTQFVFSDLSTYKANEWNIYQDIKDKLVSRYGIPADEIQFIQTATSERSRKQMIADMNRGKVRVLFGSTSMLGTGVNAQERAVAVHHLDIPWRPADMEQRNGRAVRKGNRVKEWGNNTVDIIIYGTEKTLDAYKFNLLKNKQMFINQINNGTISARRVDEDDMSEEGGMNFAEFVAILSGNNDLLDKTKLDHKIMQLEKEQGLFNREKYRAERDLTDARKTIADSVSFIERLKKDMAYVAAYAGSRIVILPNRNFEKSEDIGRALHELSKSYRSEELKQFGSCMGLKLYVRSEYRWTGAFDHNSFYVEGVSGLKYRCGQSGALPLGFKNAAEYPVVTLDGLERILNRKQADIECAEEEIPTFEKIVARTWSKEAELAQLKVEREALQKRIDKALQEAEMGGSTPDKQAA